MKQLINYIEYQKIKRDMQKELERRYKDYYKYKKSKTI